MLLGIGLFAFGCSSSTASPDDAGVDAGVDGGVDGGDEGGDQAQVSGKTRVNVTSGGGAAQSASHKVRLHVGAPQPYGEAASDGHQVQSGPKPNP
jgi:hypothetical protein